MEDLNFFAPYQNKTKETINANKYFYGAAIFVGVAIIVSLAFNSIKLFIVGRQIKNIESKLNAPEIQMELKEAQNVNNQIGVLTQYNNALVDIAKNVEHRNNISDEILNDINSNVPQGIVFKNIDTENNTIKLKGTAKNWGSIAEYKHNLSELPIMQNVTVNSIDSSGAVEGEYSFDIKCVLKDVE